MDLLTKYKPHLESFDVKLRVHVAVALHQMDTKVSESIDFFANQRVEDYRGIVLGVWSKISKHEQFIEWYSTNELFSYLTTHFTMLMQENTRRATNTHRDIIYNHVGALMAVDYYLYLEKKIASINGEEPTDEQMETLGS